MVLQLIFFQRYWLKSIEIIDTLIIDVFSLFDGGFKIGFLVLLECNTHGFGNIIVVMFFASISASLIISSKLVSNS